jgi:DNA-binding FadR family transcriptional regulator
VATGRGRETDGAGFSATATAPSDIAALFTEAKRGRADIVIQIRNAVLAGHLKKGDRLPNERGLCRIFAVSRPMLREGLRTLEALGVVTIRLGAGGGIFIAEPGEEQVGAALEALILVRKATGPELAEFRVSFEGETAYWAAIRADADQLEALNDVVAAFSAAAADDSEPWKTLVELDARFHELVAQASKNQVRIAIMLAIYRALSNFALSLDPLATPSIRRAGAREAKAIYAAILARKPDLARAKMRKHIQRFADLDVAAAQAYPHRQLPESEIS